MRRLLNLSIAHLPERLGPGGLDALDGVIADRSEVGVLLGVPDDSDESARAIADQVPDVVLAIQRHARALDCGYVLFDADADQVDDLRTWDW